MAMCTCFNQFRSLVRSNLATGSLSTKKVWIPYSGKFWRALNLANWAITGSKKIWRNFNLANSNEHACPLRRAALLLGLRTSGGARVCMCVLFTLHSSRVESLVAHARRWLPLYVRVKWSKQPKRRPEWRMAETYQVESFVRRHHVFNRVWSPTVGEQLYTVQEGG